MRLVLASSYPFLNILWTMIIFFAWVVWIWMMVVILLDVFRRRDIGGWAKAAWCVFLIVLPFIGVLTYLITNHSGMEERRQQDYDRAQRQFDDRVREVAATQTQTQTQDGAATEIEKAAKLREQGAITDAEFDQLKSKALAAH